LPLDFTEFQVACLSGNNGHGKSALLDAITWALWGEARKGPGQKKPDEGLLRLGTTHMQVEFEFDLEGERYRILRKCSKTKKDSKTTLDLQIFDEAVGQFRSISESKAGKTQEKIIKLLGMSYDTFINSAFILQGRADEFIRKGARERKAILAEVLGLSRYDELARLAKTHAQEAEKFGEQLQRTLEDLDKELVHKKTHQDQIEELSALLQELVRQIEQQEGKLEVLKEERGLLLGKNRSLEDFTRQVRQLDLDLKMLEKQIQDQRGHLEEYEQILRRREQILANYQKYEKLRAEEEAFTEKLKHLRAHDAERNALEQTIQKARHELEKNKEKWLARLAQAQAGIQEAETRLKRAEEIERGYLGLQKAREEDEVWEEKRNRLDELDKKAREVERQIESARNELQAEVQALDHQAKDLREKVRQESRKKDLLDQLRVRRSELEALEKGKEQVAERGHELNLSIGKLKHRIELLEREMEDTAERLSILRKSPQVLCPLCESDLNENKREALEAKLTDRLARARREKETLASQKITEEAELSRLRLHYKEVEKKLLELPKVREELARAEAGYEEILLSKGKLLELGGTLERLKERFRKGDYALEEQAALKLLKEEIGALAYKKEEHQAVKQRIRDLNHFEVDKANLENTRIQYHRLHEELPEIQVEISKVSELLAHRQYALLEQNRLAEVQAKMQALDYDEDLHQAIREELHKLHGASMEKDRLTQAEEKMTPAREALQRLEASRTAKEDLRKDLLRKITELQQDLEKWPHLEEAIRTLEDQIKTGKREQDKRREELGGFQSKYHRCLELEEKKKEIEPQLQAVRRDQFIYEKLATAFGKDGIQALIIESAIPELEDEANAILSRLTDHRAQITIESIRDLKGGGIKETLNIRVSDELGTRDLELYSGGESFRTNFALRIALSKLLAKRAGTRLRTLFIDEGFGTQDTQGLEQLIEAIKAIQDDFDKILIITHLEVLKNAFPVRIEVTKFPDVGSSYQLIR